MSRSEEIKKLYPELAYCFEEDSDLVMYVDVTDVLSHLIEARYHIDNMIKEIITDNHKDPTLRYNGLRLG